MVTKNINSSCISPSLSTYMHAFSLRNASWSPKFTSSILLSIIQALCHDLGLFALLPPLLLQHFEIMIGGGPQILEIFLCLFLSFQAFLEVGLLILVLLLRHRLLLILVDLMTINGRQLKGYGLHKFLPPVQSDAVDVAFLILMLPRPLALSLVLSKTRLKPGIRKVFLSILFDFTVEPGFQLF